MNKMSYYHCRIREKLDAKLNIVRFYENKYGLKNNGGLRHILEGYPPYDGVLMDIPTQSLFLGYDFLKDNYTLIDVNIADSPHRGMMEALANGEGLGQTEYFQRYVAGNIDMRRGATMPKDFSSYTAKYSARVEEVTSGDYSPVIVYQLGDRYYIYDGKHRAALCSLMGKDVKCLVVNPAVAHAGVWHYMFSIIEKKPAYGKQTAMHQFYLNSITHVSR